MSPVSLVTGAAGFIGSHIVDSLLALGHTVVALDDLSGGFRENVNPAACFVQGTITDRTLVDRIFADRKIDYVYHLAAYAAEGLSHFIRAFNYTNNVVGSMTLVNAAVRHGTKCFVFTSSIAVYGSGRTPMTESLHPRPEDPYGIAKYAVELDLAAARRMFGLNYIVFRPHNVYGERQNIGDSYRNVVGIFMNRILQGKPCTIFGDGSQTRAFTHVADIAPVMAGSVNYQAAYGEIYNIGADTPYTVKDLAELVQHAMGAETGIEHLDRREEVLHAFSDHGKCAAMFGHKSSIGIEEGLARMAAWVKHTGVRTGRPFGEIELDRNLPQSWRALCTKASLSAS